ncbi:hypothetical protein ACFWVP_19385 [Streptomyces sp. NPDC058637]|uniref:hypothetical protein n=1 Tax=Streptomyces sp. NPDC058637 TaxID=3346569 RepID=UPI003658669C
MIHIFVGPTLERSAPPLAAPGVRVCPPARHGDLFTDTIEGGDTVVLVDGVFHQAPALRHKEILAAMGRGVQGPRALRGRAVVHGDASVREAADQECPDLVVAPYLKTAHVVGSHLTHRSSGAGRRQRATRA